MASGCSSGPAGQDDVGGVDTLDPGRDAVADGVDRDTAVADDVVADTPSDTLVQDVSDAAACAGETPHLLDGKCVECRDSWDCFDVMICIIPGNFCVLADCDPEDYVPCKHDGQCHECCDDSDCLRSGFTGVCLGDGTCQPDPDCQGKCTKDFPYCVWVGGAAQCVQCVDDEDCALAEFPDCTCTGDPLYACMDPADGSVCQDSTDGCGSTCGDSGDCPTTADGGAMQCVEVADLGSSLCVDPSGHCDGVSACCDVGHACHDLVAVLQEIYPTVPRIIPTPDVTLTFCGCDTAADCLTGDPCTELSILCTSGDFATEGLYEIICPGGQLHEAFPDKLCVQPATLLEYFGVVPSM